MMKKTLLAVALNSSMLSAAALANDLSFGMTQYPSNLHPVIDSMTANSLIMGTAFRDMVAYNHEWQNFCMLCKQTPSLDNGLAEKYTREDGTLGIKLTVELKDDLYWGDGTPITTKDVLLSHAVMTDPNVKGIPGLESNRIMEKVVAVDDKKFEVYLNRAHFKYRDYIPSVLPAHLEEEIYRQDPASYDRRTLYVTQPTNPGLYNGPFRITQVSQGSFITLERNAHWKGQTPDFNRLIFKVVENTAALEAHLLSGSVDYVPGELGFSIEQALQFEKRHANRFTVEYAPGLLYEHLDTQMDNPHLAIREVRQALMYGMNREELVNRLFEGRQPVAHSNVHPLDVTFFDGVHQYQYDPVKARQLLEKAGYTLRNNVMVDKEGRPLQLELMTTAGNRSRELVQQVLQSQWRQIGVRVQINNQPARVFFGETLNQRKHQALAMFAWASAPESPPLTTLHSVQIPSAENNWAGQNYIGYNNPEMDALLEKIEVELDDEARHQLFHKMQSLYAEDLPALPLYFRSDSYVMPKWLKGVRPTGHKYPSTLWVEEWRKDGA